MNGAKALILNKKYSFKGHYLVAVLITMTILASCIISKKTKPIAQEVIQTKHQQDVKPMDSLVNLMASLVFDSSSYHFGQIKQGEILDREVHFTNKGPGDLYIDLISACECTSLDWSRLPIKPGARSVIKINYNSKDKEGAQIVDLDVIANTNPPSTFTKFSLFVVKEP